MESRRVKKFCSSAANCQCPVSLKTSFFTELKRFGVSIYIEDSNLKIAKKENEGKKKTFLSSSNIITKK